MTKVETEVIAALSNLADNVVTIVVLAYASVVLWRANQQQSAQMRQQQIEAQKREDRLLVTLLALMTPGEKVKMLSAIFRVPHEDE